MSKVRRKNKTFPIAVLIILALILVFAGSALYKIINEKYLLKNYPIEYQEYVEKYSSENGVDKFLIYAIIKTESNFNPDAVSNVGARGLMQIMDETFQWIHFRLDDDESVEYNQMFEPEQNIRYGCYLVGYLMKYYESLECAVCAYHAGIGSVDSWLSNSDYSKDGKNLDTVPVSDTRHYLNKIKKALNNYYNIYKEDD